MMNQCVGSPSAQRKVAVIITAGISLRVWSMDWNLGPAQALILCRYSEIRSLSTASALKSKSNNANILHILLLMLRMETTI